jgi:hypothetical protein
MAFLADLCETILHILFPHQITTNLHELSIYHAIWRELSSSRAWITRITTLSGWWQQGCERSNGTERYSSEKLGHPRRSGRAVCWDSLHSIVWISQQPDKFLLYYVVRTNYFDHRRSLVQYRNRSFRFELAKQEPHLQYSLVKLVSLGITYSVQLNCTKHSRVQSPGH